MYPDLIEEKLGNIENLPSFPIVLRQIQKVIHNPNSSMNQISAIVAKDPALASRTIRLVNSSFYGFREHVASISQAIVIIGLNALYHLMVGLTVMKTFNNTRQFGFDQQKFWEHCFGTALISRRLSELKGLKNSDEYFVMGLLHDVGKLILDQFLHEQFLVALMRAKFTSRTLFDCEKEVFGFDHCDVGEWIAVKWGLPESIVVSIGYHHKENSVPDQYATHGEALHIVSNANRLCRLAQIGFSGEVSVADINNNDHSFGNVSNKEIQEIVQTAKSDLKKTIEEWNKAL